MKQRLAQELAAFAADDRSGSAEIARRALEIIKDFCANSSEPEIEAGISDLTEKLIASQPSMASVLNIARRARRKILYLAKASNLSQIGPALEELETGFQLDFDNAVRNAARALSRFPKIALYSRSSTIEQALLSLKTSPSPPEIIVSEARPGYEGVRLAENLAGAGLKVTLCVDAALPALMQKAETFVTGADAITIDKFCNKIGSGFLLEQAKNYMIPAFVIAANDKFLVPEMEDKLKISERQSGEIYSGKSAKIAVFNRLFEWCDNLLITKFITSAGEFTPVELNNYIGKLANESD